MPNNSRYLFVLFLFVLLSMFVLVSISFFTGSTVKNVQNLPGPKYPLMLFVEQVITWINKLPLQLSELKQPELITFNQIAPKPAYDFGISSTGDPDQLLDDTKYILSITKSKLDPEFREWSGVKITSKCIEENFNNVVYEFLAEAVLKKGSKAKKIPVKSGTIVFPKEFCYKSIFPDETHFRIKALCDRTQQDGGVFIVPFESKYTVRILGNEVYAPMHRRPTQRLSRFVQFQGNCV